MFKEEHRVSRRSEELTADNEFAGSIRRARNRVPVNTFGQIPQWKLQAALTLRQGNRPH